jgi:hypothetical protein
MPQLLTISFLLSLTIESLNLVVSRAPYTTGAPQWPKGDCRPYFSIGLAFYQCSGGVIAINECRRKYAAKFGVPFRPCAGKRIFSNIPREYLESCIDFVRDYCIKQSSFTTELGRFYVLHKRNRPAIPWRLSNAAQLVV